MGDDVGRLRQGSSNQRCRIAAGNSDAGIAKRRSGDVHTNFISLNLGQLTNAVDGNAVATVAGDDVSRAGLRASDLRLSSVKNTDPISAVGKLANTISRSA